MLRRFEDWPARLEAEIEAARKRAFAWGRHDCAIFAANAVRAMTGVDLAADWRGRYRSGGGAERLIWRRIGPGGVAALADAIAGAYGLLGIGALQAGRGDLALIGAPDGAGPGAQGPALGVVTGRHVLAPGASGLVALPLERALRGWRI